MSKCMAMSLMGYSTEFIHMTCLNLLASQNFTQKRLAYLGICMLLDENSEILLLTSNIIKKDLSNSNQFIVAAALTAIDEIATPDMCRDSCPEVLKCLSNTNPYIKKKAALALIKIVRSCPELIETVVGNLKLILEDKNHGVLLSGLALVEHIFKTEPKYIKKFIKFVPHLLRYFKNLMNTNYAPEYDINGITDPFLQVRILEVIAQFAKVYPDDNEELATLLSSIPNNTDTSRKNTGNSVLYELVRCIFSFDSSNGLKTLGSSILGQFLDNKDNNYKYIALNTLSDIAKIDISSVQKHKNVILEYLNDPDIAIKRRSLDLAFLIVNRNNIKQIIGESLNFLNSSIPDDFILELTTKIFYSLEKYSPSLKWEIDILLKMLCLCEDNIKDEIIWKISNLILTTKPLQQYSMFRFFLAMKDNIEEGEDGLIQVGITLLGELFNLILNVSTLDENGQNVTITENDIITLIENIDNSNLTNEYTKEILMNTCFKMLGKLSEESEERIKVILNNETKSFFCEVQERANEYITFTQIANENLQKNVTKNIPVPQQVIDADKEKLDERVGEEPGVESKEVIVEEFENENEKQSFRSLINGKSISTETADFGTANVGNIQPKNVNVNVPEVNNNNNNNNNNVNLLDDIGAIFGNTNTQPQQQPANNNNNNNNNNLFDLLGNLNTPAQTNTQPAPANNNNNLFPDLTSILGNPTQNMMNNNNMNNNNMIDFNSMGMNMNMNNNNNNNMFNFNAQMQINPGMKEIYKNNEITIYSSLNQMNDTYTGSFLISNNVSKKLNNVKLTFATQKHVKLNVLSTSGHELEANASLGVKKEVNIKNNDLNKAVVLRLSIEYNIDGRDFKEVKTVTI